MTVETTTCPGCGVELPPGGKSYDRKFHASAQCWSLFEQVVAVELQDALLFGQVHQMTVDTYAVQHAGGRHPDKSVCIHLVGLCLTQERGVPPVEVPPLLQRLAKRASWPHLHPPAQLAPLTVRDVARAGSPAEHARLVRAWASGVWRVWHPHHEVARKLAGEIGRPAARVAG